MFRYIWKLDIYVNWTSRPLAMWSIQPWWSARSCSMCRSSALVRFRQQAVIIGTGMEVAQSSGHFVGHDSSHRGVELVDVGLQELHHIQVMGTSNRPIHWRDPKVVGAHMGAGMLLLEGRKLPSTSNNRAHPLWLSQEGWKYGRPWEGQWFYPDHNMLDIVQHVHMTLSHYPCSAQWKTITYPTPTPIPTPPHLHPHHNHPIPPPSPPPSPPPPSPRGVCLSE